MRTELLDSGGYTWMVFDLSILLGSCSQEPPSLPFPASRPLQAEEIHNLNVLSDRVTQTAQYTSMTTAIYLTQLGFKLSDLIVGSGLWLYASAFKRIASALVIIFTHEPPTLIWKLLQPKGISLSN